MENFDFSDFTKWDQVIKITDIIRFFSSYIQYKNFDEIPTQHWDFIVISLASWTLTFEKLKAATEKNIHVTGFVVAALELFCSVNKCLKNIQPESANKNRVNEWEDVFEQNVHCEILKMWYFLSGAFAKCDSQQVKNYFINVAIVMVEKFNC